ncbi:hypothetical protein MC885_003702 [Smutsia gigantea]|nr:hypothetical protein MC885_003702 [Smutsia gigantea]
MVVWGQASISLGILGPMLPSPSVLSTSLLLQQRHVTGGMDKLTRILDYLHQEVPKAFVNLVDLSAVLRVSHGHLRTRLSPTAEACRHSGETSRLSQVVTQWSYQKSWERLLASSKYREQESFTVVFQPFFYEPALSPFLGGRPLEDPTALALSLWNSMMEPAGQKGEPFSAKESRLVKCPSQEKPYLFTYKNSNYLLRLPKPHEKLEVCMERKGKERKSVALTRIPLTRFPPQMNCCLKRTFSFPGRSSFILRGVGTVSFHSLLLAFSVHRLKLADIKVLGALGDSLTAGNGAGSKPGNLLDVLTQYRGLSWSGGGDHNLSSVTTLAMHLFFVFPDILREFSPSLKGFSVGTGTQNSPGAFLNQAVAGDRAEDLPVQARKLVDLMKNDMASLGEKINFQEEWKIITLFIGGNDLCDFCHDPVRYSPQNFVDNIGKALDILHAEVPRAFVNLVKVLEIINLRQLYLEKKVSCPRMILRSLCPCVLKFDDDSAELASLIEVNKKYQEGTHHLVESGRYDTREDFTVVVQPFFEKVDMPKTSEGLPDSSFFAPDCFHFSSKAHAHVASALWNNMLQPVGQKTTRHNFENKINITCPNQVWPFLSTYKNSVQPFSLVPFNTAILGLVQRPQGHGSQLLCEDRAPSTSPPTSEQEALDSDYSFLPTNISALVFPVHALRPADIQVVAALGDSLTAGNGIGSKPDDLLDVTTQYRGLSYSSGGDGSLETVTTLPNILRKFNRNLKGYAVGTGDASETNAFLNQAVPRAKTEYGIWGGACGERSVHFQEAWKVITVLIGGSDLCDYCTDSNLYSAANFFDRLRNALDILHREVPRALVNLVDFMNPSIMRQVFLGNPDKCPVQQASALCNCVLTPRESSQELARLEAITQAYQSSMRELVESGRYDTREDFSVVLQPFFHNVQLPILPDGRLDMTFFAPDCIHPSQKSHSQLSRALWANMLEPLGRKTDTLNLMADIPLSCPIPTRQGARKECHSTLHLKPQEALLLLLDRASLSHWDCYSKHGLEDPRQHQALQNRPDPDQNWGSDFLCMEWNPSSSVPTSVHKLRPADIKVVAALGDSLTTALGAQPSKSGDLPTSWRGLSWSIGGDGTLETHTTLPNILKKFNPSILGFSTGTQEDTAGLNVAVKGARARDMPAQAWDLVERMKRSPDLLNPQEINLEKDWKLITLFIGSNDLCHYCENPEALPAEEYVQHIQQALDILYEELPRAFINVVEIMELAGLHQGQGGKCDMQLAAQGLSSLCPHPQSGISQLTYQRQYVQREDFAVVVQPFFQNTLIPLNNRGGADLTFFSDDCFHFSERSHAEMAVALWNNMLEPVGHKTTSNNFTHSRTKLKCPSPESPYLHTLGNSQPLQDKADAGPGVLSWAVPVAAGGGLACGIGAVMVWRAIRGRQRESPAMSLNTMSF